MKRKRKRSFWAIFLRLVALLSLFFLGSTLLAVILYRFLRPPVTPLMVIRYLEQKWNHKPSKLSKEWVSLERISPNMVQAVMASEDNLFLKHHGFDWKSIQAVAELNRKKGFSRGASSISQQTAKNVFLWPQRSWIRKGLEAYFTFLIELIWGKRRIMEVYLNVIEFGDGIYGVEKAARLYFHKPAQALTFTEAALLAAGLPAPRKWNAHTRAPILYKRQAHILKLMYLLGPVKLK